LAELNSCTGYNPLRMAGTTSKFLPARQVASYLPAKEGLLIDSYLSAKEGYLTGSYLSANKG
jgi:hypothetical protein